MWPPNYFWFDENLPFTLNLSPEEISDFFTRGFTGHEHLDFFGLINMNGRVYDPVIARFLSPDPFVQAPMFTQSYNRYSYCFNNPLSFVDPSGDWVDMWAGWNAFTGASGPMDGYREDPRTGALVRIIGSAWERAHGDFSWKGSGTNWGPDIGGPGTTGYDKINPNPLNRLNTERLRDNNNNNSPSVAEILAEVNALADLNGGFARWFMLSTVDIVDGRVNPYDMRRAWREIEYYRALASFGHHANNLWNNSRNFMGRAIDGAGLFQGLPGVPKGFQNTIKYINRGNVAINAYNDYQLYRNGELHGIALSDAIFNFVSLFGWQGSAISLGYEGAKWGATQIQELERRLRLNSNWSNPFWYHP
jgi:RHS repeat-associated protein